MSIVLKKLAAKHPDKIEGIDRDDTGHIIYLTDEWVDGSDPLAPVHMIFEDTVAECVAAFRMIRRKGADE